MTSTTFSLDLLRTPPMPAVVGEARSQAAIKTINFLMYKDQPIVLKSRKGSTAADMKKALGWMQRHATKLAKLEPTETGGELIEKIRSGKVKV